MKDLKRMIQAAQNADENSMLEVIDFFAPLIGKYTRYMGQDEDFKSELTVYLIELIHSLDLSRFRVLNNYSLINYIKTSLYHRYILLSTRERRRKTHENYFESDDIAEWIGTDAETTDTTADKADDTLLLFTMQEALTNKEYICIKLMVIDGLPVSTIAKLLHISRQTANETKLRALSKLKPIFEKKE